MEQEKIMQVQMIEQEANYLNEQLQSIDENISELQGLKESLDKLEKGKKEIMANIGKKIYLPVEVKDNKLMVNVGKNRFVKKSIPDTREVSQEQLERLKKTREKISQRLDSLQKDAEKLMKEFENEQRK